MKGGRPQAFGRSARSDLRGDLDRGRRKGLSAEAAQLKEHPLKIGTSAEDRQRLLWSERVGSKRSVTLCPFKAMGFSTVEADKALPKIAISVELGRAPGRERACQ